MRCAFRRIGDHGAWGEWAAGERGTQSATRKLESALSRPHTGKTGGEQQEK